MTLSGCKRRTGNENKWSDTALFLEHMAEIFHFEGLTSLLQKDLTLPSSKSRAITDLPRRTPSGWRLYITPTPSAETHTHTAVRERLEMCHSWCQMEQIPQITPVIVFWCSKKKSRGSEFSEAVINQSGGEKEAQSAATLTQYSHFWQIFFYLIPYTSKYDPKKFKHFSFIAAVLYGGSRGESFQNKQSNRYDEEHAARL